MLDMLSTHWHQIMFIGFLIVWATRSREQISELQPTRKACSVKSRTRCSKQTNYKFVGFI